ncbi:NADH-quinone oxidoreductase subunit N [Fodinicola feengrottensis]|uniref:NADH-quinone oxidoreductase subunit N n=1 Tax=Fodinicola feengrottensis TaxID=435914 RepID=UPI0028BF1004|nr:NADH-quinone oxidoreductase subunit N [Fodinicola feengrottensis]
METLTLPVLALAAIRRRDRRSSEAAVKMFLFSLVSTAVMLYGVSLIYGISGTVFLSRIAVFDGGGPLTWLAILLVVVGFGFKISLVPFHFWAPDTYSGAPVSVAGFSLSVISKAGGLAGLILVLVTAFGRYAVIWGPWLAVLAAITMTMGNLVALRQTRIVRLLAWSSIAHAGYMLTPLAALAGVADRPELVRGLVGAAVGYLAIYALMTIGVFAVVSFAGWVGPYGGGALDDYRGLARSHPLVALCLAFLLASLAGVPPGLAGFFAKIFVFRATVAGGYGWLAVLMAINAVIGLSYYLSWAVRLFDRRPAGLTVGSGPVPRPVAAAAAAIAAATAGTALLSVVPGLVLGFSP